jgi:hypothetical protein
MMLRRFAYVLLFLCPLSHAGCALNRSAAGTLSISVSGDGRCFRSDEERQAFAEDFKSAVREDGAEPRKPVRSNHDALLGFDHLRRQSETLNERGPIYYGQRP